MKLKEKNELNELHSGKKKLLRLLLLCLMASALLTIPAFATIGQYAEKMAKSFLEVIYWIVLAGSIGGLAFSLLRKNITVAIISGIATAICVVLIKNPEIIQTLGDTLFGEIGLTT